MKHARTFPKSVRAILALLLLLGLWGCQLGNPPEKGLKSISLSADYTKVPLGIAVTYKATGNYDGRTADITNKVTWSVSDESKARIVSTKGDLDPMGTLFPHEAGEITVTASLDGQSDSLPLEISSAELSRLEVTPYDPTYALATQDEVQFSLTAIYSDGQAIDVTEYANWGSSKTGVALVGNVYGSRGLVVPQAAGSCNIKATYNDTTVSSSLTLTSSAISSLEIERVNPSLPESSKTRFVGTVVLDDDSIEEITTQAIWSSATTSTASISNIADYEGRATTQALSADATSVLTLTLGSTTTTTTLTGKDGFALSEIQVTPAKPVLQEGQTYQLEARGVYANSTLYLHEDLTEDASWVSSKTSVATVCNSAPCKGLVTAVGPGTATITVRGANSSITETATITVLADSYVLQQISVSPADQELAAHSATRAQAWGIYSNGSNLVKLDVTDMVDWTSSKAGTLFASNQPYQKGWLAYSSTGNVTLTAVSQGVTGTSELYVWNAADLDSLVVTPLDPNITVSSSAQFQVFGHFANTKPAVDLTKAVLWSSSDLTVLKISNAKATSGKATSLAAGSATVTATLGDISATTTATVLAPATYPLSDLVVTPAGRVLPAGAQQQFSAMGIFTNGTVYRHQDLTQQVTWTSSNPAVIAISNRAGYAGRAAMLKAGSATITAQWADAAGNSKSHEVTVTVKSMTLDQLALTPQYASLSNRQQQFLATAAFKNSGSLVLFDLTKDASWVTAYSDRILTDLPIGNSWADAGLASWRDTGSIPVSASFGTVTATTQLTNNSSTLKKITLSPTTLTLAPGVKGQFEAYGDYADGTRRNITAQVTWTSDQTQVTLRNDKGFEGQAEVFSSGTDAAATISAQLGGKSSHNSPTLSITSYSLSSIEVTPSTPTLDLSTRPQFTAIGTFTNGSNYLTLDISKSVTWRSSNNATAVISNQAGDEGTLYPLAAGSITVTASWTDSNSVTASGTATATLVDGALNQLTLSPAGATVAEGYSTQLSGSALFKASGNYHSQDITEDGFWTSANPEILAVSNKPGDRGRVTGISQGKTTVTLSLGAKTAELEVTVW